MNATIHPGSSHRHKSHAPAQTAAMRPRHIGLIVLAALLALLLLVGGVRLLLAGIADYQTDAFLKAWNKAQVDPDPRAWAIAEAAAQRAVTLSPAADGERYHRLAQVYSWKQRSQPYGAAPAADSRRAARDAYRTSVALRPTWPYTWSKLAHSKLALLEFDAEFAHALRQATLLGPTRIGVRYELALIGLSAWPRLTPEQREGSLASIRFSVAYSHSDAQRLLGSATQMNRLEVFCSALDAPLISSRKLTACQK